MFTKIVTIASGGLVSFFFALAIFTPPPSITIKSLTVDPETYNVTFAREVVEPGVGVVSALVHEPPGGDFIPECLSTALADFQRNEPQTQSWPFGDVTTKDCFGVLSEGTLYEMILRIEINGEVVEKRATFTK